MEKASVYLFTSSRKEGWGAVLNESMNSGCAVVASYDAGSVPFMVRDGENGFTFNNKKDLFKKTEKLLADDELRKKLGKNAYITVRDKWNAELAAERLSGWLLTGCVEVPELYLSESAPDWLKDIPAPMDMVSKEI
jgi:glycosyltransferase involved in cell wall biosynthesis